MMNDAEWAAAKERFPIGSAVAAVVADHRDRNRQIQLRVGPPVWEKTGSARA
ncbi:hypothetical protein [Amycolatopsis sp. 3B14]|uniref:hypothetical protein n=1 Tax=Amycolatopsis sp. 3B14 TaxID=3243600 RepID=UPI003D98FBC2